MQIHSLFKSSEKLLVDNAPTILSAVAVVGTGATAVLAVRGGYKAGRRLSDQAPIETRPKMDVVKDTWTCFIPAFGAASLTIGCIVCANKISAGRIAGMAAAYSLSESKLKEYKSKIAEKFGIEEEKKIQTEVNADKVQHGPSTTIVLGEGEQVCFDAYSGRYFTSTYNKLQAAANEINRLVNKENYQTLDDFWDLVGLEATAYGTEYGFTVDCPLELQIATMMSSKNEPCLMVQYDAETIRRWNHFGG